MRLNTFIIPILFLGISTMCTPVYAEEAPDPNMAAWDTLKSLVGEWVNPSDTKNPDKIVMSYRYIVASNVVMETYDPGLPTEEITIYARDNDAITLTHFCSLGSTAHMRNDADPTNKAMSFTCAGPSDVDSEDDLHMHHMELNMVDKNHIQSTWTVHKDSKKAQAYPFDLRRKQD